MDSDEALVILLEMMRRNLEAMDILLKSADDNPKLKHEVFDLRQKIKAMADSMREH